MFAIGGGISFSLGVKNLTYPPKNKKISLQILSFIIFWVPMITAISKYMILAIRSVLFTFRHQANCRG